MKRRLKRGALRLLSLHAGVPDAEMARRLAELPEDEIQRRVREVLRDVLPPREWVSPAERDLLYETTGVRVGTP